MTETLLSPIHKWGLDPLFMTHRNIFVKTLREIISISREEKYEFYLYNRPVKKVRVCGIVFEKIIRTKYDADKVICKVDDGTGVVECVKFLNTPDDHLHASSLAAGTLVIVMGNLYLQHNEYVIQALSIEVVDDPNMESVFMLQTIHLHQSVYQKPYILNESTFSPSPYCCAVPDNIKSRLLYCRCCASPASPWDDEEATLRLAFLNLFLVWEKHISPLILTLEKLRDPEVFDIIRRNSTTILKLLRHDANGENRTTIDICNTELDDARISQHILAVVQALTQDGILALQDDTAETTYVLVTEDVLKNIIHDTKAVHSTSEDIVDVLVTAYPSIPHWRWRCCLGK